MMALTYDFTNPDVAFIAQDAQMEGRMADALNILMDEGLTLAEAIDQLTPVRLPQVGDILACGWGYGQTRYDFYKVVRVTKASVAIAKMSKYYVTQGQHGEATVMPNQASDWEGETKTKRFKYEPRSRWNTHLPDDTKWRYSVRITDYSTARLWDGEPCHESGDY